MQDQTPPEAQNQPEPEPAPAEPATPAEPKSIPETKPQENVPMETPQELPPEPPPVVPVQEPPKPPPESPPREPSDFRAKVLAGKKKKLEARLQKVVKLARSKGKIRNDDIQKHLHVSDATATRYSQTLIRRGLLKKSGRGKGTFYEPI